MKRLLLLVAAGMMGQQGEKPQLSVLLHAPPRVFLSP